MIKASFLIATVKGPFTVTGYKTHAESLFGVDLREKGEWHEVTFLPLGSKVSALFTGHRHGLRRLIARIEFVEALCPYDFYGLMDLPWGCTVAPPSHTALMEAIKAKVLAA